MSQQAQMTERELIDALRKLLQEYEIINRRSVDSVKVHWIGHSVDGRNYIGFIDIETRGP